MKIVSVRGEDPVGVLVVHVAEFDSEGNPVPAPSKEVRWEIPNAARPSVNRILAGIGSEEDAKVLELAIANIV